MKKEPDRQKIREIVGYTHQKEWANATSWYGTAVAFREAAAILHDHKDSIKDGFRVFAFNAGLSLEQIIKAVLAANRQKIPRKHNLRKLAENTTIAFTKDQQHTLDHFTDIIVWRGRYPTPKTAEQWDHYHDQVVEKTQTRSKSGAGWPDPKSFPNIENYLKIWGTCLNEYLRAQQPPTHGGGK
jgi:HEPN domain-containing protein